MTTIGLNLNIGLLIRPSGTFSPTGEKDSMRLRLA